MNTEVTLSPWIAAEFILKDELVAFPTETVYGLGANVFSRAALQKVFVAKGRPPDNPLIAHIAHSDQVQQLSKGVPEIAARLMECFFPGPLTVILPKHNAVPLEATAGLETIGVRMPAHPVAAEFLKACKVPVAAPSANRSGRPSPTTWDAVHADLAGRIACILKGGSTDVGLESTVVDCTGEAPVILRAGAITLENLRKVDPRTTLATAGSGELRRSPGTRYKHYAPSAKVCLLDVRSLPEIPAGAAFIGISQIPNPDDFVLMMRCEDVEEYARKLFDFFRRCDREGINEIYCEIVPESGLGLALMDRVNRAAGLH